MLLNNIYVEDAETQCNGDITTSSNKPKLSFHDGDEVEVVGDVYAGCRGVVYEAHWNGYDYRVDIQYMGETVYGVGFDEHELKLVKRTTADDDRLFPYTKVSRELAVECLAEALSCVDLCDVWCENVVEAAVRRNIDATDLVTYLKQDPYLVEDTVFVEKLRDLVSLIAR